MPELRKNKNGTKRSHGVTELLVNSEETTSHARPGRPKKIKTSNKNEPPESQVENVVPCEDFKETAMHLLRENFELRRQQEASLLSLNSVKDNFYGVPVKNHNFIDRPKIFANIETILNERSSLGGSKMLVLRGLGGMGKTQIMLRYCYSHHQNYDFIFWLKIDSKNTAIDSFRKLAINLGLDTENKYPDNLIMEVVCSWLQKKTKWLLLLDNADDVVITEIFKILPKIGGDVILTTREYVSLTCAKVIHVDKMEENEALSLLFGTEITDADKKSPKFQSAKEIIAELDCIPFAIELARAYIENMQLTFKDYLSMIRDDYDIILSHRNEDSLYDYNHTLRTIWQLSLERIQSQNPTAALILDACAFLQPDFIPVRLFERQHCILERAFIFSSTSSSSLEDCESSLRTVRVAIAMLVKSSFMTRTLKEDINKEDDLAVDVLAIHPLVQKVLLDSMSDERKIRLADNLATAFLNETGLVDNHSTHNHEFIYLWHIHNFITTLDFNNNEFMSAEIYILLVYTTQYILYNNIGLEIEDLVKLIVSNSEFTQRFGSLSVAKSMESIAKFYRDKNKLAEAELLYQQTLMIKEAVLGDKHVETAKSLSKIGMLFYEQDRFAEAEPLLRRVLAIRENELGPDHLAVARSLFKLATTLDKQGKVTKAEPLYRRALEIATDVLGPNHRETLISVSYLAVLYGSQEKYIDAEPLCQRLLNISSEIFECLHPQTATSLNNVAVILNKQNRFTEAESLYKQALEIYEKVLGPEKIYMVSLNNLASLYRSQGKYPDAEPLYQKALTIMEKVLGPKDVGIVPYVNSLALLYFYQGKYIEAEPLLQRALTLKENVLGPEHQDTVVSLNNLAALYKSQGNFADAEQLLKRASGIKNKTLGPQCSDPSSLPNDPPKYWKLFSFLKNFMWSINPDC